MQKRSTVVSSEQLRSCIDGGEVEDIRKELEKLCKDELQAVLASRKQPKGSGKRKDEVVELLVKSIVNKPLRQKEVKVILEQRQVRKEKPKGRTAKEREEEAKKELPNFTPPLHQPTSPPTPPSSHLWGRAINIPSNITPWEIVKLIFNEEVVTPIVDEINVILSSPPSKVRRKTRKGKRRKRFPKRPIGIPKEKYKDTPFQIDNDFFYMFLAILLQMMVDPKPKLREYWSKSDLHRKDNQNEPPDPGQIDPPERFVDETPEG